ncbi:PIN domain-containing protein [Pseudomonas sp. NPDC007930]|uniref:type II toxin-antitoxin system VapC family toxin n=1 Tax=Pseudomonas sp. NPDC007930 TaxID=3364417 RepID=UPI0036EF662D
MIVLDTNVLSEAMRPTPNAGVITWLNEQLAETLFITSVTIAELMFGVANLPEGKRKDRLSASLDELLKLFGNRVLPFDTEAAKHHARLAIAARRAGRGFPTPDGYIAAIATAQGFMVATRDCAPYEAGGVRVINPWG